MKIHILILFLSLSIISFSCKKDVVKINAGIYNSSFIYHEYSPALELNFIWDEQLSAYVGEDSIDIDFDSNYDMFITLEIPDSWYPCCKLELKNGFEVAICKETYGIGHGQYATAIFVDTLSYGDIISNLPDWSGDESQWINMWHASPGTESFAPSYGSWYYANNIKYIGLKSLSDKYGWIEVDAVDPYSPKILRYAIQQ